MFKLLAQDYFMDFHAWVQSDTELKCNDSETQGHWILHQMKRLVLDTKDGPQSKPFVLYREWEWSSIPHMLTLYFAITYMFFMTFPDQLDNVKLSRGVNQCVVSAMWHYLNALRGGDKSLKLCVGSMGLVVNGRLHVEYGNNAPRADMVSDYESRDGMMVHDILKGAEVEVVVARPPARPPVRKPARPLKRVGRLETSRPVLPPSLPSVVADEPTPFVSHTSFPSTTPALKCSCYQKKSCKGKRATKKKK